MASSTFWPDQIDAHRLLVEVGSGRSTATYQGGQTIYKQGDAANAVYFVQQGAVELTNNYTGLCTVLGLAKAGQFFGGTCLYDVSVRIASARATVESRITSVTKSAMLCAIRDRPRFAKMFTDHLWYNNTSEKDLLGRLLKLAKASEVAIDIQE